MTGDRKAMVRPAGLELKLMGAKVEIVYWSQSVEKHSNARKEGLTSSCRHWRPFKVSDNHWSYVIWVGVCNIT